MLDTAGVHLEDCKTAVVSLSTDFESTYRSYVNFRAQLCAQDHATQVAVAPRVFNEEEVRECFTRSDLSDYKGRVNTTHGGYACQKWSSQTPHRHLHIPTPDNAWQGIGDHNYCRALSWDSCAWCYTTVMHPKWECCIIGSPQPSCPIAGSTISSPPTLSEAHRAVFDRLVDGECPHKLIMIKLVSINLATRARRSGWYEVESEESQGIADMEAFLIAGHHDTLPGQTVGDILRERLDVQRDGVFRCTANGLFFEPKDGRTRNSSAAGLPRSIHVSSLTLPELNATVIELDQITPMSESDVESFQDSHVLDPPRWWEQQSMQTYVLIGLAMYVGSLGLCAVLSYVIGRTATPAQGAGHKHGGRSRLTSRAGSHVESRMSSVSPSLRASPGKRPGPRMWRAQSRNSVFSAKNAAIGSRSATWQPTSLMPSQRESFMLPPSQALAANGQAGSPTAALGSQGSAVPMDQVHLRRVHDMAATTIQRQMRDRPQNLSPLSNYDDDVSARQTPVLQPRLSLNGTALPLHGGGGGKSGLAQSSTLSVRGGDDGHEDAPLDKDGYMKRLLVPLFRELGLQVARKPWTTIVLSLVFAVALTAGLFFMTFEANSYILYIPQKSDMALTRKSYEDNFGTLPDVLMIMMKRRAGGSIITKAGLSSALAVYKQVEEITAEMPVPAGASHDDKEFRPITLSQFCYKQYVVQIRNYMCGVESILQLWGYQHDTLNQDPDVQETTWQALSNHTVDMGLVQVNDETHRVSADAIMVQLYFNTSAEAYTDGRFVIWHTRLRERLPLIAQHESLVVSWWSTRLNEEEANSFVKKDSPLLMSAFVFVIVYVAVSLSDFRSGGEDGRPAEGSAGVRIMLSLSCALCSALSLSAGFGLTALLGTPITPVSPLVSFMLLGVSVDNMIIIVDTFDRMDSALGVDVRLSRSVAEAGTAITVTTFTTLVAFTTGVFVDLPVYAWFCTTSACCVLCLYILQLTLFCALLVVDSNSHLSAFDYEEDSESVSDDDAALAASGGQVACVCPPNGQWACAYPPNAQYACAYPSHPQCMGAFPPNAQWGCAMPPNAQYMAVCPPGGVTYGPGGQVYAAYPPPQAGASGPGPRMSNAVCYPVASHGMRPPVDPPPSPPHGPGGGSRWDDVQHDDLQLPSNAYSSRYDFANEYSFEDAPPAPGNETPVGGAGSRHAAPSGHQAPSAAGAGLARGMPHLAIPDRRSDPHDAAGAKSQEGDDSPTRPSSPGSEALEADGFPGGAPTKPPFLREPSRMDARQEFMGWYARVLLKSWVRALVLVLYLGPVIFAFYAVFVARNIKPGLPYRQTVPKDSIITDFLDDADAFFGGAFPVSVVVVFEDIDPTDRAQLRSVREALDGLQELDYVNHLSSSWLDDYEQWTHCYAQDRADQLLFSTCNLEAYLADTEYDICGRASFDANSTRARRALAPQSRGGARSSLPSHGRGLMTAAERHAQHEARLRARHGEAEPAPPPDAEPAEDAGDPNCVDDNDKFLKISQGHVCAQAAAHGNCEEHALGWHIVRQYCPLSCGLCTPPRNSGRPGAPVHAANANATTGAKSKALEAIAVVGGKGNAPNVILKPLAPGGCDIPAALLEHRGEPFQTCPADQNCIISAARFIISATLPQNMEHAYYVWRDMQGIMDDVARRSDARISGYVYHVRIEFGYFDHMVLNMGLSNLGVVVIVIAVCVFVFLPFFISALAVFSVVCIDLQLLSVMSLAGLNFNSISCISLLIALGLAIDYSVHLGHAFNHANFPTRDEKVVHALQNMGSSILNAGGSTLLGTLFLGFSSSVVFRTFFIFMWGTIFLGLFSGLAFAPVVLSLIGPLDYKPPKPDGDVYGGGGRGAADGRMPLH